MKTAKEMFEKLGWEKFKLNEDSVCYRRKSYSIPVSYVIFYLVSGRFQLHFDGCNFEHMKGIMECCKQQSKELGWLDE